MYLKFTSFNKKTHNSNSLPHPQTSTLLYPTHLTYHVILLTQQVNLEGAGPDESRVIRTERVPVTEM